MKKIKTKNKTREGILVVSAKEARKAKLFKIGQIAQEYRILPSTINFYTREGLLPEDARSIGGYRLYHRDRTLERLKTIEYLQERKRLTIEEIKKTLS